MARPSKREDILAVATQQAKTHKGDITLEAVAAACRMSKGGLLYHFPDKDALMLAVATQFKDEVIIPDDVFMARMGIILREKGGAEPTMVRVVECVPRDEPVKEAA